MTIKFKYNKEDHYVSVEPRDSKYGALSLLGNRWQSSDVQLIQAAVQNAQIDDTLEDFTIDGVTGYIWVFPDEKKAEVFEFFTDAQETQSLLDLNFSEVMEFLDLLNDYLLEVKR